MLVTQVRQTQACKRSLYPIRMCVALGSRFHCRAANAKVIMFDSGKNMLALSVQDDWCSAFVSRLPQRKAISCLIFRVLELLQFFIIFVRCLRKRAHTHTHAPTNTACQLLQAWSSTWSRLPFISKDGTVSCGTHLLRNDSHLLMNTLSSANTRCFRALHIARRSVCVCFAVKESICSPSKHGSPL